MIRAPLLVALFAAISLGGPASAAPSDPSPQDVARPVFLPPDEMILRAIEAAPELAEAQARLQGARAERRLLAAGDYETTATLGLDRRDIRSEGGKTEWSFQLSRGLRSPAKAVQDRKAGEAGQRAAEDGVEDARHQLSLTFTSLYLDWLNAEALASLDADEVANLKSVLNGVVRRAALKDASRLETEEAQAALARAEALALAARSDADAARRALEAVFPGLAPEHPPALPAPSAPSRAFGLWPDIILARSHELAILREEADRERALAVRARLDRTPDPVIGLRTFNERGGLESGVGVFVSIPLSGARRAALQDRQGAASDAARLRYERGLRDLAALARQDSALAGERLRVWEKAAANLASLSAVSDLTRKAYAAGERDMAEALAAERQVFEGRRNELAARVSAHAALIKLHLDAHEMWLREP